MTIWKFELELEDRQTVSMPKGAVILSAHMQGRSICIWAMVDPSNETEPRTLAIVGTGYPIPAFATRFVGTVVTPPYVWHVFEA